MWALFYGALFECAVFIELTLHNCVCARTGFIWKRFAWCHLKRSRFVLGNRHSISLKLHLKPSLVFVRITSREQQTFCFSPPRNIIKFISHAHARAPLSQLSIHPMMRLSEKLLFSCISRRRRRLHGLSPRVVNGGSEIKF
jgi:hypothetical protein